MLAINRTLLSGIMVHNFYYDLVSGIYQFKMLVPEKDKQMNEWPYIKVNCSEKVFNTIKEYPDKSEVLVEGSLNIYERSEIELHADRVTVLKESKKGND